MILGMSGFARSGKDAAADYLVKEYGFTRVAFADKLRDFLYALNPIVDVRRGDVELKVNTPQGVKRLMLDENTPSTLPVSFNVYVQDVIDQYGWDHYKETEYGGEIRRLLQRLGTEAGRDVLWDTIWIDAVFNNMDPKKDYVISDARFLNEFKAVCVNDGYVVRVNRPGVGPANEHPSEMEALKYEGQFDYVLNNNGTLAQYYAKLDEVVNDIRGV